MSLPVNDTFTRADESPLAGNYTKIGGGGGGIANIYLVGNAIQATTAADSEAAFVWTADTFANDQWGSLDATTFGGGGGTVGINLRTDPTGVNRTHYYLVAGGQGGSFLLGSSMTRRLAGVKTVLTSEAVTDWGAAPFPVYCEAIGDVLNIRQGGSSGSIVLTYTDTGGIASGSVGPFMTYKSTDTDIIADNFQANNLTADFPLTAGVGTLTLNGVAASVLRANLLTANVGALTATGAAASAVRAVTFPGANSLFAHGRIEVGTGLSVSDERRFF